MKRWILLSGIVLLGIAAIVVSERQKVDVSPSPQAILYLVADTEKELTRLPVRFTRMSDEEEIRVGDELASGYSYRENPNGNSSKDDESRTIETYLNSVGAPLAAHAHRKLPYKFHYLPDPYLINAFALPGGHVYVGRGLLAMMDSEDELASVLGHEIEHIDQYHCAERVQVEQAVRKLPLGGLVAIPMEIFEAGYNKDQELQADREGTRLAVAAGYSANGAIRMFEAFQKLYNEYQHRAQTPQEELSHVAEETIEGYFRSHPLPAERVAQIQKLIASEGWTPRAEKNLGVAYIFWTARAQHALANHRYEDAKQLALGSLAIFASQPMAEEVLAQAQFALADFSAAADSYRKLLGSKVSNATLVQAYALTLAAADKRTAAAEFHRWMTSIKGEPPPAVNTALAGLELLAGESSRAQALENQLSLSHDRRPTLVGELGWYHYLAGQYPRATELLEQARQESPGNGIIAIRDAWTLIEARRLSDALQMVQNLPGDTSQSQQSMAQAVAMWQAGETDRALGDFGTAIALQPEWTNPQWTQALYSPQVTKTIQQMTLEREQRQKKAQQNR